MDGARKRKQTRLTNFWKRDEITEGHVRLGKNTTHLPDRLSELPEPLLIKILSMLDMREAVKTGILSTRWKLLWTQVDSIVYRCYFDDGTQEERNRIYQQLSFVDRTLMQCTSSNIQKFRLSMFGCRSMSKRQYILFDKWIAHIMQKNVESMNLCFRFLNHSAPDCLYRNSSLVNLKLGDVSLSVTSPVSWPSLRSLNFNGTRVDDDSFANILLGCPVLETIVIDGFSGIKNIEIMSPSVKKLKLANPRHAYDKIVKVNAPWLQELQLGNGEFFIRQFQLVDVSSLKRASLWFCHYLASHNGLRWNEMVEGLFKSLSHVDELVISMELIHAFALSRLMGKPYPLFKCKHMTVHVPLWKYDLYGIACLLQNAPYLETLLITVGQYDEIIMACPEKYFRSMEQEMSLPEGNLMHLKYVKIDYERNWNHFVGDEDGEECLDFELVEYILRSTSVLEKLVIMSSGTHCERCSTTCSSRYVPRLSSKLLLMYLVGNETLQWELVKTNASFDVRFSNYTPLLTRK